VLYTFLDTAAEQTTTKKSGFCIQSKRTAQSGPSKNKGGKLVKIIFNIAFINFIVIDLQ
jgi:predicted NUDIX family NTP pyrophosphohydrolase